jgi:hypothetical protein
MEDGKATCLRTNRKRGDAPRYDGTGHKDVLHLRDANAAAAFDTRDELRLEDCVRRQGHAAHRWRMALRPAKGTAGFRTVELWDGIDLHGNRSVPEFSPVAYRP